MILSDLGMLPAIGACFVAVVVIGRLALQAAQQDAQRRANWRSFFARDRALRNLGRILWGPPRLTHQRAYAQHERAIARVVRADLSVEDGCHGRPACIPNQGDRKFAAEGTTDRGLG